MVSIQICISTNLNSSDMLMIESYDLQCIYLLTNFHLFKLLSSHDLSIYFLFYVLGLLAISFTQIVFLFVCFLDGEMIKKENLVTS